MEEKTKYEEAVELRELCDKKLEELRPVFMEMKDALEKFYNLMRWEKLGCSTEEYEKLYENLIHPVESLDIFGVMNRMSEFLDPDTRKRY